MKHLVKLGVQFAALAIATALDTSRLATHVTRKRGENGLIMIGPTIRGNCENVDSVLCKIYR